MRTDSTRAPPESSNRYFLNRSAATVVWAQHSGSCEASDSARSRTSRRTFRAWRKETPRPTTAPRMRRASASGMASLCASARESWPARWSIGREISLDVPGLADEGISLEQEATLLGGGFPGVIHSDAAGGPDALRGRRRVLDEELAAAQVEPVLAAPADGEGAAEVSRADGRMETAFHRLAGADQDRRGKPLRAGDHVHAVGETVDQIDVGEAGRAEHDGGAA